MDSLPYWEANYEEGWYSLTMSINFAIKPERYIGDWVQNEVKVKLTCYSCLRQKPKLTKAIDSPTIFKIEKDQKEA